MIPVYERGDPLRMLYQGFIWMLADLCNLDQQVYKVVQFLLYILSIYAPVS